MTEGATMRLAELVVGTKLSDVDPEALRLARGSFVDTVGVALAGRTQPAVEKAIKFIKGMGGEPKASVVGAGFRTSPWAAALANGTAAATLEYDDNSWRGVGHFSGPNVTAALALAEAQALSGRDVLLAHIVGFETANKLGVALQPGQYFGGRHATGTLGVMGATASCAKLLGLDARTTAMAFGIAASAASAIRGNFGTMTKGLHTGMAASNAIMAALLAADGFTARPDIIETAYGYAQTTVKDDSYRLDEIGRDWGNPWEFAWAGLKFQPTGSMSFCAGPAAEKLATEHDLKPEEIEAVFCRTSKVAIDIGRYHVPEDANEAQYSIPWAVAVALTDRRRGLAQFSAERIKDPVVRELCSKVEMSVHPDLEGLDDIHDLAAAEVTVVTKDGRRLSEFRWRPIGYPGGEPWTDEMLEEKFREAAGLALPPGDVERAWGMLRRVEELSDIRELMDIVRGSDG
jgi:2-methylcitrate dehydratase PrpD